ncbi:MAG: ABC transporter ATP-binding protein [Chlorobi bacterium]|nr:ABC transporter ATP-binding protein [Chlorobiota bacterium]
MIELKNIYFSYDTNTVLEDFSLTINNREITCILGNSGCGKTTILRLIAGLETPEKGDIIKNGILLSANSRNIVPPDKRNTGFIFQDLALWPHFTVYKNIEFGLKENKVTNAQEKVMNIMEHFGIKNLAKKYPHQLSGGQKQLVAISRSLVLEPDILLMDEPLSNLDIHLKRKILEHIKALKDSFNVTIVYVTHDHREAFSLADKIIVLNNGKTEAVGSVDEIKKSENNFLKSFLEY